MKGIILKRFLLFFLTCFFAATIVFADQFKIFEDPGSQVSGYVYLQNTSDYSNVTITFERIAPTSLSESVQSSSSGYYSINLESGIYNISYSKDGYIAQNINNISVYSDVNLDTNTLFIKGTLINVPSVISTIQAAIDAAADGDTVLVAPGTYYENINFNSKAIDLPPSFGQVSNLVNSGICG